ncbi:hypothetical protein SmJEL517_g03473 [Synchytrium microbalum]|uniref:Sm domain-containing protein n=1 Tax=Synchytrium microbalum TaxID=1806994 RepID=A0A507C3U4_9FUNG|nr:uncharacterized protein SmJEL517_g03473 [Synchytrium microbalum]TPX33749.1 hypothetical protein SmJEL517_g03473 [Synchytrium microbalum]
MSASAAPPAPTSTTDALKKRTPSDFIVGSIGSPVMVKLSSGVDYRGILSCLDGYMNIALEQTEEWVDGKLKNKYGDCFIRGNNDLAKKVGAPTYDVVGIFGILKVVAYGGRRGALQRWKTLPLKLLVGVRTPPQTLQHC